MAPNGIGFPFLSLRPCALLRCLKSCQDIGVACQSNLSNALLTCTIYTAEQGSTEEELQTISSCLEAFLNGDVQHTYEKSSPAVTSSNSEIKATLPDDQAAARAADDSEDDSQYAASEATADADVIDDYLMPPTMHRHWQPLVSVVGVPALPKGALVEVQPEACNLEALNESQSIGSDDSSDDDQARQLSQGNDHVIGKRRASWASLLVSDGDVSPGNSSTSWSSLTSVGAYCCCQAVLCIHAESVNSSMQDAVHMLSNALAAAQLTAEDVTSMTVFMHEGLEHLQYEVRKAFQLCWTLQCNQRMPYLCVLVKSLASGEGVRVRNHPQSTVLFRLIAHKTS